MKHNINRKLWKFVKGDCGKLVLLMMRMYNIIWGNNYKFE